MTVEEAIKRLREQVAPKLPKRPEIREAIAMAVTALEIWEKEKEPQPEQADKDSSKNNFIYNDNIKLKICQEVIEVAARILTSYVDYLPEREQELWKMGGAHALLKRADKLFEEEKQ